MMSHAYWFDVVVTASPGGDNVEQTALRKRARLVWHVGPSERAFYGILASVRVDPLGDAEGNLKYRLRLVPRLWLLRRASARASIRTSACPTW